MAFLDEIAAKLVAAGVGTLGTDIFLSSRAKIPDGDGPYLSIKETGGTGAKRTQTSGVSRPTAQIMATADTYPVARAKLKLAWDALGGENGLTNVTLSGTVYLSVMARQEPTDIGLDARSRAMVGFNFDAEKKAS